MAKHLSDFEKACVICDIECGVSYRDIAKKRKISLGAISKLVAKHKTGELEGRKRGSGRTEVLSEEIKDFILDCQGRDAEFNAVKAAGLVEKEFNHVVCPQTIRNFLHSECIDTFAPTKKPHLTERHKKARLDITKKWSFMKKVLGWSNI